MNQERIEKDGVLIAQIITGDDWTEGLSFFTEDKDFLQVATWKYRSGKHLKAHSHKISQRQVARTNEMLFVRQGKIKAVFYDEQDTAIAQRILGAGSIVIIYAGGHGYDILEDSTYVLEVKNGPYPGLELDKHVIES